MCSDIDDEPRFRGLIAGWIAEGSVPSYPAFIGETEAKRKKRKRKTEAEAKEAEEMKKELGLGDESKDNTACYFVNISFWLMHFLSCDSQVTV